jgi:hypothetical protein
LHSERAKSEGRAVYFFRLVHKAGIGLLDRTDQQIVAQVGDITAALIALTEHAVDIDDGPWLRRHVWRLLAHQLNNELPTAPLDG